MSGPRRVLVTGSVATDHLMAYRGRFADQIVPDRLDRVSLSFLADTLEVRPGGVAANIALGLARLGLAPVLAAAAGRDFGPYRSRLRDEGVETGAVHVSDTLHTARFVCTTDTEQNQIATFYAGAMAEARHIRIADVSARHGPFGMALIGPDDPRAMLLHTGACRRQGLPFAADPSQQLAALDRAQTRNLVTGSRFLFTNEYEAALLQERTGWTHQQVLDHTGTWIITRGADGVDLTGAGHPPLRVPAVPPRATGEPTGVGDGFRAGFLAATAWGRPPRAAARLGCALATVVLETVGPQQYVLDSEDLGRRLRQAYGPAAARELTPWLNRLGGETGSRRGGNRRAGGDTGPDLGGVRRAGGDTGADAVEDRRADEGTRSSRDEGRRTREDAGSGRRGDEGRRLDRPAGGVGRSVGGEGRSAGEGAGSGRRGDEGRRLDRPAGGVGRSVGGEGRSAGEGAGSGRRGDEGRRLDRPAGGVGRSVGGEGRSAGEGAGSGRCADEETRPYRPADGGGRSVQGGGRPAGAGPGSGGRADEVTPAVRRAGEGTRSPRGASAGTRAVRSGDRPAGGAPRPVPGGGTGRERPVGTGHTASGGGSGRGPVLPALPGGLVPWAGNIGAADAGGGEGAGRLAAAGGDRTGTPGPRPAGRSVRPWPGRPGGGVPAPGTAAAGGAA